MVATKSSQKGAAPRMRNMLVAIPDDVYKALKHHAVEHEAMMRDIVAEALRKYLGLKGGEKDKK
jgi:hypothetical protein